MTESGLSTEVARGENHGKVLKHAPVVRYLATVGELAGAETAASARAGDPVDRGWRRDPLAVVAFVQESAGVRSSLPRRRRSSDRPRQSRVFTRTNRAMADEVVSAASLTSRR